MLMRLLLVAGAAVPVALVIHRHLRRPAEPSGAGLVLLALLAAVVLVRAPEWVGPGWWLALVAVWALGDLLDVTPPVWDGPGSPPERLDFGPLGAGLALPLAVLAFGGAEAADLAGWRSWAAVVLLAAATALVAKGRTEGLSPLVVRAARKPGCESSAPRGDSGG